MTTSGLRSNRRWHERLAAAMSKWDERLAPRNRRRNSTLSSDFAPASSFAGVEVAVGGANQVSRRAHPERKGRDAGAGADACGSEQRILRDRARDARRVREAAAAVRVCEDGNELVATKTRGQIHRAGLLGQHARERA